MKFAIVFVCLVAAALAAPIDDSQTILLKSESEVGVDGYHFAYETSDGTSRSESAVLKNAGTEQEALSVTGTITWTAADGQLYTLKFVADENGFQPEAEHLPVGPIA